MLEPMMIKEINLTQLEPKSIGIVSSISADERVIARLAGLGVTIGSKVTVLDNRKRGPLLIKVRNTKIAFGRKDAEKIIIKS